MLNRFKNKLLNRLVRRKNQKEIRDDFIRNNKSFWAQQKDTSAPKNSEKIILVEITEKNPFELESNMRVAKTIEHLQGMDIVVLLSAFSRKREPYFRLAESYLISRVILTSSSINKALHFISSFFGAVTIFRRIKTLVDIEEIKYREILIGDLIYDTYIRMLDGKYSPQIDHKLFKYIVFAIYNYKTSTAVFDNNNVEFLVIADKSYLNHGILYRIAVGRDIKTLMPTKELKLIHKNNIHTHFYHPEISLEEMTEKLAGVNFDKEVGSYFKERFAGNIDSIEVLTSYRNKKIYSKSSIEEILTLDIKKKNVVIMPHAFSDFPHIANGLYSDYYVWLVNLLKIVKEVDNVNWIIKPHPTSYIFKETGVVENMLNELGVNNVKIVPNDMNTASVKDFADVILTVRGTPGLEFATFGIPVVTAGDSCYSGYGLDVVSVTKSDYENTIRNLHKISKLDENLKNRAKMIFYFLFIKQNAQLDYLMTDIENNMVDYDKVLINIINNNKKEHFFNNTLFKETADLLERLSL
jgi:hypothetical protein